MSRADGPLQGRMIFNFGAPRSGTFWLQRIVTAHPAVAAVPSESDLFWLGIGPLFDRFHHGLRASATVAQMWVDREVLLDATRDFCDSVFEAHLTPGARYLAERSPMHVHSVGLISEIYPDARLVHIIRDGRDVARSHLERTWGPDSIAEAADKWAASVRAARDSAPPERYYEVRYEALLAEPRPEIAKLYDWLELEYGDDELEQALVEARIQRNHDPKDPRPIAEKWRDHFSAADIQTFEDVAGDLLDDLGYARAGGTGEPVPRPEPSALPTTAPDEGRPSLARALLRRAGLGGGRSSPEQAASQPAEQNEAIGGAMARAQGVVDELLTLIHSGRTDDVRDLLADDVKVMVAGSDGETVGYGPDAFTDVLRADPAWRGRQLRGDMLPGLPSYSVVLSYELDDGTRADRMLSLVVTKGIVKSVRVYKPPL